MNTGCQPPYCHGTGGFCGCNCKCCPPPCCPIISVYFQCCTPESTEPSPPAITSNSWENLPLSSSVSDELPNFNSTPIFSADRRFTLGLGSIPSTCPCETVCIQLKCGGITPCCCLELLSGVIYSVGNGYVTAPTSVEVPGCGTALVFINGLPSPVFVNDCEIITVTLQIIDESCCTDCQQIDVLCSPCPSLAMAMGMTSRAPLFKRKVDARTGKTKLNPNTGKPIIVINKSELINRIKRRINKSKRGGKN